MPVIDFSPPKEENALPTIFRETPRDEFGLPIEQEKKPENDDDEFNFGFTMIGEYD